MAHPIKHFRTITKHRHKVIAHCAKAGILWQKAWLHHKGRNRHHYEFWNDYNPKTKSIENVEMPVRYVVEMFCDRVAASKIYKGKNYMDEEPYIYYLRIKGKHRMHENTEKLLCFLLEKLRDEGEEATFAYLRAMKKK